MTLSEAMEYLSGLVDYEKQSAKNSELTLDAVRQLLDALGNPQDRLFIVLVAGTKGKGSVSTILELILRKAGYRTGLYTSPHLLTFEERFRVNGDPVSREALASLVECVRNVLASAKESGRKLAQPTAFDVSTALAYLHFAISQVDVAIVEVGMGGRNDSTNVCSPRISVITSVSYDHMLQLGDTLSAIASEKAGVIRPRCPTISGVSDEAACDVIRAVCEDLSSELYELGREFNYQHELKDVQGLPFKRSDFRMITRGRTWPQMPFTLLGQHQAANAAVAICATERLRESGFTISEASIEEALLEVRCPARIEVVQLRPLVIIDCAHNVASAVALRQTLLTTCLAYSAADAARSARRTLIFACSRDKKIVEILQVLLPIFDRVYLTRFSRSGRCASEEELLTSFRTSGACIPMTFVSNVRDALEQSLEGSTDDDLICVAGSIFLAGEAVEALSRSNYIAHGRQ